VPEPLSKLPHRQGKTKRREVEQRFGKGGQAENSETRQSRFFSPHRLNVLDGKGRQGGGDHRENAARGGGVNHGNRA